MRKILIGLSLSLVFGVCDVAISQTKKTSPQVKPQSKVQKILTNDEKAQLFTQSYFDDLVDGETGYAYFCKDGNQTRFFSPRSYKILSAKIYDKSQTKNLENPKLDNFAGAAKVRLDSSNKGGSQVTSTWKLAYYFGEMSGATERTIKNKINSLGVCINSIFEDNKY